MKSLFSCKNFPTKLKILPLPLENRSQYEKNAHSQHTNTVDLVSLVFTIKIQMNPKHLLNSGAFSFGITNIM